MRNEQVKLVEGVDDVQLGLLRIHDALGPAVDYVELLMLAAQALGEDKDAIGRGAYACLGEIQHAKDMIEELRNRPRGQR